MRVRLLKIASCIGAVWMVACANAGEGTGTQDGAQSRPGGGAGAAGSDASPNGTPDMGGADDDGSTIPGAVTDGGGDGTVAGDPSGNGNAGDSGPNGATGNGSGSDPGGADDGDDTRPSGLQRLERDDGFLSIAPPLGDPLPAGEPGIWHEETLPGTVCRDGSEMRIQYRYSESSTNYVIFLEGGGVCFDDFFCPLNPQNVDERVDGESIIAAALGNLGGAAKIPQAPNGQGIWADDPRNPLADWNAVYVPYCSGDVYGGTRSNVSVPRWPAGTPQEFNGYANASMVLGRVVATFLDADKALLTGSSAGGVGALLHGGPFADLLVDHTKTRGFVVSDSGPVFDDPYLEVCIQQEWRELWGLDAAFPSDCEGCFESNGGGIARGLGDYLFKKYPQQDQVIGGLISSVDDEIMKLFFGKGLDACMGNPFYPLGGYQMGLEDFANNVTDPERFGTYFMPGSFHMHLTNARFYATNGVSMSVADWLGRLLENEAVHVGP